MFRTIKQRMYLIALMPLALLSLLLIAINGTTRTTELKKDLMNAQRLTAELLMLPATDALEVGNVLAFEQVTERLLRTSPSLRCIALKDSHGRMLVSRGGCSDSGEGTSFVVASTRAGLSDFEPPDHGRILGELRVVMDDSGLVERRRDVVLQLTLSILLVAVVLVVTGRILRRRLVEPVSAIGEAVTALGRGHYETRVQLAGNDELANLAVSINDTIGKVAAYTRELERRRADADRALQDADDARLARDALVKSLTADLEEPLRAMQIELTSVAVANTNPALKPMLRTVLASLQEARENFSDLMEVAAVRASLPAPSDDLAELLSDLDRDIRQLSQTAGTSVSFAVARHFPAGDATALLIGVDGVRLRKAVVYIVRALGQHCTPSGLYVDVQLMRASERTLHMAISIRGFHNALTTETDASALNEDVQSDKLPRILAGHREARVIDYLLRTTGTRMRSSLSVSGAISVFLEVTCELAVDVGRGPSHRVPILPIVAVIVSDDESLSRVASRSDLSTVELRLLSYAAAKETLGDLAQADALLIDMSEDVASAVEFVERLGAEGTSNRCLIAICPPGRIGDSLSNRLFELGFKGLVQKPVQYARLVEAIEAAHANGRLPVLGTTRHQPPFGGGVKS